ncbi:uncharacterized protein [Arachis hypogaea]|uniref:uncharacterized protein n=1 Tax=Arachis hypogaea TaxID=3818 RepID=UPI000DEC162C|nr:uncharacterized protein LOC112741119 isoform X1 [Arachis hypogaea]
MKLCRFTVFFPLDITVTAALSSFTLPLCLIDANSSPLPLSASVSLTVSDKLVVAFLRSPVLRAFPTLIVAGGSSSSSRDWMSSSLPVLSPPRSQSRAVVAPFVAGDRSSRSPNFLLAFSNSSASFAQPSPNLELLKFMKTGVFMQIIEIIDFITSTSYGSKA